MEVKFLWNVGRDSSVGKANHCELDGPGIDSLLCTIVFVLRAVLRTIDKVLVFRETRPAVGPTRLPIQWAQGYLSRGVKRPRHGVNHPPPSSAEVKDRVELYLYSSSGLSLPVLGRTLPLPFNLVRRQLINIARCCVYGVRGH